MVVLLAMRGLVVFQSALNAKTKCIYCREMVNIKHGHEAESLESQIGFFSLLLITLSEEGGSGVTLGCLSDIRPR